MDDAQTPKETITFDANFTKCSHDLRSDIFFFRQQQQHWSVNWQIRQVHLSADDQSLISLHGNRQR